MIYCDASLIVAILTAETSSEAARDWLERSTEPLAISRWTIVEVASALAMKQRRGTLDSAATIAVERNWRHLMHAMIEIPVWQRHFDRAAGLATIQPRGLRAGDALHVAIAADRHMGLATLDRDMADAAAALQLVVHRIVDA